MSPDYEYTCIYCGAPSQKEPSEQAHDPPVDYCWPESHEVSE